MENLIEMKEITKEYRGALAVNKVDFSVRKGEIHALVGENGAGKSTVTKMIVGAIQPTSGTMLLDGQEITFESPRAALLRGIAMVFQETSLVPSLTVAQNLYLGDEPYFNRLRGLYISAQQFLQSLNFSVDPARFRIKSRCCAANDGRDGASGSPQRPADCFRRADSDIDA